MKMKKTFRETVVKLSILETKTDWYQTYLPHS